MEENTTMPAEETQEQAQLEGDGAAAEAQAGVDAGVPEGDQSVESAEETTGVETGDAKLEDQVDAPVEEAQN